MKQIILGLLLVGLWTGGVYAQDSLNSVKVENKTLHFFYQKEWKSLIQLGKKSIAQGIDFKALNYRVGIAYYELGKYNEALVYFTKVEKETILDVVLQEYIYYSCLLGGRVADARLYAAKMDVSVKEKVGFKTFRILDAVHLDGGTKLSSLPDSVGHMPLFSFGLSHRLGNRFKLYHHFSFLTQKYQGLTYNQYEYYAKAEIALNQGLQLFGAFHYTGLEGGSLVEIDSFIRLDVINDLKVNGLVGLLGLKGNIGNLKWKTSASFSNWVNQKTTTIHYISSPAGPFVGIDDSVKTENTKTVALQFSLDLDYKFPINKISWFSLGGQFSLQSKSKELKPIWGLRAYYQANDKLAFGLHFLQAQTTYYHTDDAYLTSNTLGVVDAQIGATFRYQIIPQINWYIDYTYEKRNNGNLNFDYHILSTGLKFTL